MLIWRFVRRLFFQFLSFLYMLWMKCWRMFLSGSSVRFVLCVLTTAPHNSFDGHYWHVWPYHQRHIPCIWLPLSLHPHGWSFWFPGFLMELSNNDRLFSSSAISFCSLNWVGGQNCRVCRKCFRNPYLLVINGLQCRLRDAISSKGTRAQIRICPSAHFVCSVCQQRRRVNIYPLTDMEACFFLRLGFLVSFVLPLSGFLVHCRRCASIHLS